MRQPDPRLAFDLGQPVCASADRTGRVGRLVAVMLVAPFEGLVRWSPAEATFEPLDELVAAPAPQPHVTGGGLWPETTVPL